MDTWFQAQGAWHKAKLLSLKSQCFKVQGSKFKKGIRALCAKELKITVEPGTLNPFG
jgi:hypothetical protein